MNNPSHFIQISLNGEARSVSVGLSLAELVASFGLPPQTALVEHNGQALLRSEWVDTPLADGDRLEILRVVAGG